MSQVKEFLTWYEIFLDCPPEGRRKIKQAVMQAIREYSALGEGRKDRSVGERLYQKLKDSDEYLCRGVVPSVEYAKLSGSKEELAARWVHPFSVPTLLFKHKSEPILILVNPGIRLDESFIQEMRHNQRYHSDQIRFDVDGITG